MLIVDALAGAEGVDGVDVLDDPPPPQPTTAANPNINAEALTSNRMA